MSEHAKIAELVHRLGVRLWKSTLIGNAPESTHRLYSRMASPRVGDLVVELTGLDRLEKRVGYLTRIRREYDPSDDVWYIKPLGREAGEIGWGNAKFVAIDGENWPS